MACVANFTYRRSDFNAYARAYDKRHGRTFGLWLAQIAGWIALALFVVPILGLVAGLKWDRLGEAWHFGDAFVREMSQAAPYVLVSGVLGAGIHWFVWHRRIGMQNIFQHACRMEIDETGIMCEYAGITHKAERHWFTGRYEERDVVILLGRTEGYMAVPRRGFDSASDFEGAVTLVRTKVAAIG